MLYQPLTLLDCLHTFCGSCLKEWFTAQGGRRQPRNSDHRFTCPSCRAGVRATRPNATVTTLLDMVLASQPGRARTEDEKKEIAERYKPGDSVFPPPQAEADSSEDEEDERLLAQIQEMSLRESRLQTRREERREERRRVQPETNRARSSNPDTRHTDEGRSRRRREEDPERQRRTAPGHSDPERARRVEHQSSLRSLLSLSSETETMEEEILRQIIEEGLLNDIDLDNLGPAQEEELSERIADAYRRRHMRQSNSRPAQRRRQSPEASSRSHARSHSAPRRSGEGTTGTTTPREHGERRPPVSRPHLLESSAPRPTGGHQRRNSEQASVNRRTSPVRVNQASNSDETLRPAARSSSDMTSERPRSSQAGRPRAESSSRRPRRGTESEQPLSDVWMAGGRERISSRHASGQAATNSPTTVSSPPSSSHPSTPVEPSTANTTPLPPSRSERRPRPASSRPSAPSVASVCYAEPNLSCDGCGKSGIQYELHKRCFKCKNGEFHLCLRCYRSKKCCPEWAGFPASAKASIELMLASSNGQPRPTIDLDKHILTSFKYQRPPETARIAVTEDSLMTNDNPRHRLETGLFCDICKSSANECWWKCDQCNDGDWGFCNRCVNQGRCCTHPLLPIRRIGSSPSSSSPPTPTGNVNELAIGNSESYKILSISTNCDICTYPIPASVTRFHCLKCNDGDYDVCTNCYRKLVATSKISKENGYSGWRRCLAGHRTIVIGFKDHEEGQRRTIVRGLVGGFATRDEHINQSTSSPSATGFSSDSTSPFWAWKEGHERRKKTSRTRGSTTSPSSNSQSPTDQGSTPTSFSATAPAIRRFPPDGGVGLVAIARWSWYPEEGVKDELTFPRGAEIMEVENVNDDWFCGSYAGSEGLFPGNRVMIDREIV